MENETNIKSKIKYDAGGTFQHIVRLNFAKTHNSTLK